MFTTTARRAALAVSLMAFLATGTAHAVTLPSGFTLEDATPGTGFDTPTAIAFLPDGALLVAEKRGRVYAVRNGVKATTPLWNGEQEVRNHVDRGLIGIAVDPAFATNRFIYLLYTADPDSNGYDGAGAAFGRLTRYQVSAADPDALDPASRTVLLGSSWNDAPLVGSPSHTIGALRWGEDGSLLVSTGEGASFTAVDAGRLHPDLFLPGRADSSQDIGAFRSLDLGSLSGKVLRIDPLDGGGLASNPWFDGNRFSARSRVWSVGLRNPFRFTVRPGSGNANPAAGDPGSLYIADVGWNKWEEIDIAPQAGMNFGWPCYEGRFPQDQYQTASPYRCGCDSIGAPGAAPAAQLPAVSWSHDDPGASEPEGLQGNTAVVGAFYSGIQYPAMYQGLLFFADFARGWIDVLAVDPVTDTLAEVQAFATGAGAPVDMAAHPISGDIHYVDIYGGKVMRIHFNPGVPGNTPPVAIGTAHPDSGASPLAVQFSSAASYDPDGDAISKSWLFGDLTGSPEADPQHTYQLSGVYYAVLTVEDVRGGITRDTVRVAVGDGFGAFPTTPVLDTFDRPDGAIGPPWFQQPEALAVSDSTAVQVGAWSWMVYGTQFGPTQEAFVRIGALTPGAPEHNLMLKVQGDAWDDGHVEVRYDDATDEVKVATYTPGPGWQGRGTMPATFVTGDVLGARARADGRVDIFQNGTMIGTTSVAGWPHAASGGRIGLTVAGAPQSRLDDFGGGTAVMLVNTRPDATILTPAGGSHYVDGDLITLTGSGTDAQQGAASLDYHWQIDLHHNIHVHPSSILAEGPSASFTAEDHDDGTGVHYEILLIVTDQGGLKDTSRVAIYPETDLQPVRLSFPDTVGTAATPAYAFTIHNHGRMTAPLSRWRLVAGDDLLAQGDVVLQAQDSVNVSGVLPVGLLQPGTTTLRVVVDTLAQVNEIEEGNNAAVRAVQVQGQTLDAEDGLPGRLSLSAPRPNPTRGRSAMALELPRRSRVELSLLDVQGRIVGGHATREYEAGRWELSLEGRGPGGAPLGPGLYFARVTVGDVALVRRVVVMR